MNKELLNINYGNNILSYFPYGDEKLYIDLLIKEDENARGKAKEYAGYLEELKDYVIFENETEIDEIIEFLKSKSEVLNNISQEEKREYMELKFDVLDLIKSENNIYKNPFKKSSFLDGEVKSDDYYIFGDKNSKEFLNYELKGFLEDHFPIFGKFDKNIFLADYFCNLKRNSLDKNLKIETIIEEKHFEEQENPEQIQEDQEDSYYISFSTDLFVGKEYFLFIPYLIPIYKKWTDENPGILNWDLKFLKFELNNEAPKELFNKFIFLESDNIGNTEKLIKEIFTKTNLFCDYRFFDREMFKM